MKIKQILEAKHAARDISENMNVAYYVAPYSLWDKEIHENAAHGDFLKLAEYMGYEKPVLKGGSKP